jgi:AcrR family transcriptional regulator
VGEVSDRRARKKAQTREQIRGVAHALFAERGFEDVTIADIARAADVAVQTVFNHFATKEELFFDGRTPWVDGPARAVRERSPGTSPLSALRAYLVEVVHDLIALLSTPDHRCYVATLEASDALRAHERELVHESERRLTAALLESWTAPGADGPADPETAAPITAAVWLAATRVLIVGERVGLDDGPPPDEAASAAHAFADRLLAQMEISLQMLHGVGEPLPRPDTGWPEPRTLRAG